MGSKIWWAQNFPFWHPIRLTPGLKIAPKIRFQNPNKSGQISNSGWSKVIKSGIRFWPQKSIPPHPLWRKPNDLFVRTSEKSKVLPGQQNCWGAAMPPLWSCHHITRRYRERNWTINHLDLFQQARTQPICQLCDWWIWKKHHCFLWRNKQTVPPVDPGIYILIQNR